MDTKDIRADGYVIERIGNKEIRLTLVKGKIKEPDKNIGKKDPVPVCHLDMTYGAVLSLMKQIEDFKRKSDTVVTSAWGEPMVKGAQHHASPKKKGLK